MAEGPPSFHMTPDELRRWGHEVVDWVADYWATIEQHPVVPDVEPGEVRSWLPPGPPEAPQPFADVIADLDRVIVPGTTHWQHPGFHAFFPANTSGPGVLADIVSTAPAVSNAARYARIITEHALLRRLIGVASEIAELGYALPDDVIAAVDRAEAMVFDVAQRRVTDTMAPIRELLDDSLTRLEMLYEKGDAITVWAGTRLYTYAVDQVIVLPDKSATEEQRAANSSWIGPFEDDRLTLVSCWPRNNNTHRIVVIARPPVTAQSTR